MKDDMVKSLHDVHAVQNAWESWQTGNHSKEKAEEGLTKG